MEPRIRCELCGKGQKGPSALREHYSCTHFFQVLLSDGQIAGNMSLWGLALTTDNNLNTFSAIRIKTRQTLILTD